MSPRPRHVVILVENLPVPFDRRPWQIAQSLHASGRKVSVICPKMYEYTAARERLSGIDICRYPSREGSSPLGWILEYLNAIFWMTWHCWRIHLRSPIDAIHACNPPDLLFLVALPLRMFCGVKFLFDHHDLNPEVYVAKFGRKDLVYRALCLFEKWTYRLATVALTTNESFRRIAVARSKARASRIFVVRNAPKPGRLTSGPPVPELREGFAHVVGYIGVMNKQDGLDLLLEAARRVVHEHGRSDVLFALIGDGPELPALRAMATRMSLEANVRFLGRIADGQRISDWLNTASVCVCPDPRNEMNDHSTMTKIVEYMALGRPTVAFDLAESIHSAGDSAAWATNNDPSRMARLIVELLDDEPRRNEMGARARARYDSLLSWPRQEAALLAAYRRLLDGEEQDPDQGEKS